MNKEQLLQEWKYINRNLQQQLLFQTWNQINYAKHNNCKPIERWGHQIIERKNHEQIYLFGGYGSHKSSEGKYFNDIWMFSIKNYTWCQLKCFGEIPQAKSNYSFHYNTISDEIILFGGGGDKKVRFNSVFILDCKTRIWKKYNPQATEQAPWERTYHTSQFSYPYLIIHGGQGVSNLDLDDMWVFNVITKKWKMIEFEQNSNIPIRRRFHSSFLWKNYFYIIGGCNQNYSLIGDVHRVNLQNLFQKHQYSGYNWECIISYNSLLQRWGHTCNVINAKVYIICGRISLFADTNQTIIFDLEKNKIQILNLSKQNIPKARRRHSSVVLNDCILIFGGYNGKYLNDFHFLRIRQQQKAINASRSCICHSLSDLQFKISQYKQINTPDISIKLLKNDKYMQFINTHQSSLIKNTFFRNFIQYSSKQNLIFQMPSFCDTALFKIVILWITEDTLFIPLVNNTQFYKNLVQTCNYLNCNMMIELIENELVANLNEQNCQFNLNIGIELKMNMLIDRAAKLCLLGKGQVSEYEKMDKFGLESQTIVKSVQQENELRMQFLKKRDQAIKQAYIKRKFIIQQAQLKQLNTHFIFKTAKKIKEIFISKEPKSKPNIPAKMILPVKQNKRGCLGKLFDSLMKLCCHSPSTQKDEE